MNCHLHIFSRLSDHCGTKWPLIGVLILLAGTIGRVGRADSIFTSAGAERNFDSGNKPMSSASDSYTETFDLYTATHTATASASASATSLSANAHATTTVSVTGDTQGGQAIALTRADASARASSSFVVTGPFPVGALVDLPLTLSLSGMASSRVPQAANIVGTMSNLPIGSLIVGMDGGGGQLTDSTTLRLQIGDVVNYDLELDADARPTAGAVTGTTTETASTSGTLSFLLGPPVLAETPSEVRWIDSAGGSYADVDQWDYHLVPGVGQTAVFDLPDAYSVSLADNSTDRLVVHHGDVSFHGATVALTVADPASPSLTVAESSADTATAQIVVGGLISTVDVGVAQAAGSRGTLVIDGPGSTLSYTNLSIGTAGDGELDIRNGGEVQFESIRTGSSCIACQPMSTGSVTVTGAASRWNVGQSLLLVGDGGMGSLTVGQGAKVETLTDILIGNLDGASGEVVVNGTDSEISTDAGSNVMVGDAGQGSLEIEAGGKLSTGALPGGL